ncbi:MAG TPA: ATP-binding protein, partial [Thermoanaerobaculia bacterium]|nr:ATP-binding protein [Thermoanaerobaculia bacterium]
GRLAGGIAHDFNNLMTTVIGFSDLLLSRVGDDERLSVDLLEIRHAGERAAALTKQLLAFSRQQAREPKVLDLNAVIRDHARMLERLVGRDVEVLTKLAAGLPPIKADADQLEQVLGNLAMNAGDAMPRGGRLSIETHALDVPEASSPFPSFVPPGRFVELLVSDSGRGMDEEVKRRAFEPFFTTKEKGKGAGLGLSTVYGIVKQSGGYVTIESAAGAGGTTIHVLFPPAEESLSDRTKSSPSSRSGGGVLLLVEDEEPVRRLLSEGLARAGYRVLSASSAGEALDLARTEAGPIDLLVSDWMLPDAKGDELLHRLREVRPGTKVLFVSGYAEEAFSRGGVLEPGESFLMKPVLVSTLAEKIRGILDDGG